MPISRSLRVEKGLWLFGLLCVVFPGYYAIGLGPRPDDPKVVENTQRILTSLDAAIPLQPAWMFVYAAVYTSMLLPMFVVHDRGLFRRVGLAYLFALLTAYACFLVYPVTSNGFLRPPLDGFDTSTFWGWGLALNYYCDPPMNCLPSIHLAIAFTAALSAWKVDRPTGAAALALAALVGVSTALVKQHYVADVFSGVALALVGWAIFLRPYGRQVPTPPEVARAARRGLLHYAGLYALTVFGLLLTLHLLDFRPWEPTSPGEVARASSPPEGGAPRVDGAANE
ncbi:MAG: phosphatase PAP2 family protein [Myxococcales bacterium]|nr:phosphatase PAP2 family protein [Myxococcales bacterium]